MSILLSITLLFVSPGESVRVIVPPVVQSVNTIDVLVPRKGFAVYNAPSGKRIGTVVIVSTAPDEEGLTWIALRNLQGVVTRADSADVVEWTLGNRALRADSVSTRAVRVMSTTCQSCWIKLDDITSAGYIVYEYDPKKPGTLYQSVEQISRP
ncbi:MAG TPA: hypothetical protein PLW14_07535 [Chlorobiota bacterium]|nr:hypothetical protein [Chlorobiota bacterium]